MAIDPMGQARSGTKSLGTRLRQLRVTHRRSQMQLATKFNVSVPAVSAWEHDRPRPRHGSIAALGKLLGVSTAELLGSNGREFSPDVLAESRAHIARVVGTTTEKVRILIGFWSTLTRP
ncbi:helix-turn-helix transcriptional regulator [Sphingopyxis sp.]|uniref:helix-turn-helix domain-containing protein n=1 Tax=Sphingopyxis sp. TaxID=1908224 RepID=UPI0025D22B79|nr:helix-turn-helix transcriptional regulator [Sphingopyxis sp.]MBK6413485.1 helix-turn-helix transcriptional regulator [Sphingopyxis sp.]